MATLKNSNGPFDLEATRAWALRVARASDAPNELMAFIEQAMTAHILRLALAGLQAHLGMQMEKLAEGFVRLGLVTEAARLRARAARAQIAWQKALRN